MPGNPAPGYAKYPDHRIATKPAGVRVRVTFKGDVIADSSNAVAMQESTGAGKKTVAPTVYYIPRGDVRMDRLARTDHSSYCPFKGHAAYYSIKGGAENAVWSYEEPYDEASAIRELLAFYPDKVEIAVS